MFIMIKQWFRVLMSNALSVEFLHEEPHCVKVWCFHLLNVFTFIFQSFPRFLSNFSSSLFRAAASFRGYVSLKKATYKSESFKKGPLISKVICL